ncbi:hypothetical protein WDW86_02270 [Bdellovibrionota bacterium FG-2]
MFFAGGLGLASDFNPMRTESSPPSPPPASPPYCIPSPVPALKPAALSTEEIQRLLREFQRAQIAEVRAFEHRQKFELRELKASQAARQREWEKKEREDRHKFFLDHTKGPERRAYITEFLDRRKMFMKILSDERASRGSELDVKLRSLKEEQQDRVREFRDFLDRRERPPVTLWPDVKR